MSELGRLGGRRSGEVRRQRAKTVSELVSERFAAEADVVYRRIRAALDAGDVAAALAAVRAAANVTEDQADHIERNAEMLERRRSRLQDGSRWQDDDERFVEL